MKNLMKWSAFAAMMAALSDQDQGIPKMEPGTLYENKNGHRSVVGQGKVKMTKKQLKARARAKAAKKARRAQRARA